MLEMPCHSQWLEQVEEIFDIIGTAKFLFIITYTLLLQVMALIDFT